MHLRRFPARLPTRSPAPLKSHLPRSLSLLLALFLVAIQLGGCAGRDQDEISGADALYQRAQRSMNPGNYPNAIRYYEALEGRYPFSNQTKQAQLDLIFCYFKDRQIEAAVDAATQFER